MIFADLKEYAKSFKSAQLHKEIYFMKTQMNTRNGIIAIAMVVLMAWTGFPVFAQEDDYVEGGRNWDLMIGGGGILMPKYLGSDKIEFQPVPFLDASLRTRYVHLFVNVEEGAGISLKLSQSFPLILSAGVNIGEGREHDAADVLKGTRDIENSYCVFGGAELDLPPAVGELSATVTYAPTTVDYQEAERNDTDYNGLLVSFDWENDIDFSRRFRLDFEIGLT
jgi:outer membrane scaffolding protein for murein synthesis (MipA/OmpV family)